MGNYTFDVVCHVSSVNEITSGAVPLGRRTNALTGSENAP